MKKVVFIGGTLDGQVGEAPELAPVYKVIRTRPERAIWSPEMVNAPPDIEYDEYRLEIVAMSTDWKFYFYVLQGVSMKFVIEQMIAAYQAVTAPPTPQAPRSN